MGIMAFLVSLGSFVFIYGKGTSYLSNNPAACANCHVMTATYESWSKSDHAHVAGCNDCHVPHHPVLKWVVKGVNGFQHSYAFTFQELPSVLRAAPLSKLVVQTTCTSCHAGLIGQAGLEHGGGACVRCHSDVGHEHH
ncbi:MAG: cytochrome c nitrite reductase small subunit [Silvanigrellales bacterium]|nr:cytochrome c nitrite reductase small subunit [Silvanigrellales bacterium]